MTQHVEVAIPGDLLKWYLEALGFVNSKGGLYFPPIESLEGTMLDLLLGWIFRL